VGKPAEQTACGMAVSRAPCGSADLPEGPPLQEGVVRCGHADGHDGERKPGLASDHRGNQFRAEDREPVSGGLRCQVARKSAGMVALGSEREIALRKIGRRNEDYEGRDNCETRPKAAHASEENAEYHVDRSARYPNREEQDDLSQPVG
jgi:hypothetical protein